MKSITLKLFLTIAMILFSGEIARARSQWQADVQVRSVNVTTANGRLTTQVEVYSDNDDVARNTTLYISLPVGTQFLGSKSPCTASSSISQSGPQGFVTCTIGNLKVREARILQILTTTPPSGINKNFGAFAWSITPDPMPSNNFAVGQAP